MVCITLPGAVSQAGLLDNKRVPVPRPHDTSSESSRRDASNADVFGTATIPTIQTTNINTMKLSTMKNRPRGV